MERSPSQPDLPIPFPRAARRDPTTDPASEAARARELAERARRGDLDAWSRLYQDHFDAVLRHICFMTGDAMVAEDLVQETFARAMTSIAQYDGRAPLLSWLRGIALNLARMHWRRSKTGDRVRARLVEMIDQPTEAVDATHHRELRMQLVYDLLATLPVNLREAFVVRELEGLPNEEAAAALGISPGNVAVRASRARARIRKELERLGWTGESS